MILRISQNILRYRILKTFYDYEIICTCILGKNPWPLFSKQEQFLLQFGKRAIASFQYLLAILTIQSGSVSTAAEFSTRFDLMQLENYHKLYKRGIDATTNKPHIQSAGPSAVVFTYSGDPASEEICEIMQMTIETKSYFLLPNRDPTLPISAYKELSRRWTQEERVKIMRTYLWWNPVENQGQD